VWLWKEDCANRFGFDGTRMSKVRIPESIRQSVREAFDDRCAYCLSSQRYSNSRLEVEHITPKAVGGGEDEVNLCLSCRLCNLYKGVQMEPGLLERQRMGVLRLRRYNLTTKRL
jgi:5-methylcytosine-specific restriction endonuclease McrA